MDQSEKARLVQSIDESSTDEEVFEILGALVLDLCENDPEAIKSLSPILVFGSGPIEKGVLEEIVEFADAVLAEYIAEAWTLILGRSEWTKGQLDDLLRWRSGSTLRVYSQELFCSFLENHADPLERPADKIRSENHALYHPGLKYLEQVGFDWPTTIVSPGNGGTFLPNALENGFLSHKDYHVGQQSKGVHHRHAVLRRVLNERIPKLFPFEHRQKWGEPGSSARLEKTANTIAWRCRLEKQMTEKRSDLAIRHWEEDLDWLKSEFYQGRYRFQWPHIEVW